MGYYYDDDYYQSSRHRSKNIDIPPGIHIMNKNEKTALRKLKKETGLSEEEIRKEKKYRKILSDAQVERGSKDDYDRKIISIVKYSTRETKLPLEHPKTKEKIKESIEKPHRRWGICDKPSVEKVIQRYKSLKKENKILPNKK